MVDDIRLLSSDQSDVRLDDDRGAVWLPQLSHDGEFIDDLVPGRKVLEVPTREYDVEHLWREIA